MIEGAKVTGNAQLFLGYVTGALSRSDADWPYRTSEADPAAGTITVVNSHTGSVFLLSVVQIEGEE